MPREANRRVAFPVPAPTSSAERRGRPATATPRRPTRRGSRAGSVRTGSRLTRTTTPGPAQGLVHRADWLRLRYATAPEDRAQTVAELDEVVSAAARAAPSRKRTCCGTATSSCATAAQAACVSVARSARCDVDKHIGELIERGRGEAGDGLLGELLPASLSLGIRACTQIAELRHMVTRPSVGDGRRTTNLRAPACGRCR